MKYDDNTEYMLDVCNDADYMSVFGFVTDFMVDSGMAKIKLADGSEWLLAEETVLRHRALIELSIEYRTPILLTVNKETQIVGFVFPTIIGIPVLIGETADRKQIQVSVPPSPRVFCLRKDRPWFLAFKTTMSDAQNPTQAEESKLWISYDSVSSEIVDVRPSLN